MARSAHRARAEETSEAAEPSAPARGIWSGSISFGLLQIPVTLYSAEKRTEEIHFHLLDKHDMSRVKNQRINAQTGKPVEWKDIVKGYEIEPDTYVVMDPEELAKANVKATQTIDIQDFVPSADIEPEFFDTPYFVVPQARARKAYVLLREALKKRKAVAVATFVLRTREHLVAIMPVGDALVCETLRFRHELRRVDEIPIPHESAKDVSIAERELAMADQLVSGMMTEWDPARYKDRWHQDVRALIEEKAKTGKTHAHNANGKTGAVATDVVDLLDLLKKSVASKGQAHAPANDSAKKPRRGRKKSEAA